jgi:lipopolysaccharide export system protein LptC
MAITTSRTMITPRNYARRSSHITLAKKVLPAVAIVLLLAVALWPEWHGDPVGTRLSLHGNVSEAGGGEVTNGRYNGQNDKGEPFTVTADSAQQKGPDRVNLSNPVGDITMGDGAWLQGKGQTGVYDQQHGQLDLSGDVTLYRDDGTMLKTDSATIDTKSSAAISNDRVHVEGPLGTLDAQGFSVLDNGQVVRFNGPARMVINGAGK